MVVSALAGTFTLALVWSRRYEPARYGASIAVAAIIAGWALAQSPLFLRDLTVRQAAAPHDTLVAVVVAVVVGGLLLFPSLALLFGLVLRGRFERGAAAAPSRPAAARSSRPPRPGSSAAPPSRASSPAPASPSSPTRRGRTRSG